MNRFYAKYLFILSLVFLFLYGCSNYRLSKKDMEWQPYKVGDILIFESNKKETDTIFITEIKSYSNPEDNLSIVSSYHETLFVSGQISLSEPVENNFGYSFNRNRIELMEMYADDDTKITFCLNKMGDSLSYPKTLLSVSELQYIPSFYSKNTGQTIKFKADDYYFDDKFDLQNIWWSKKHGYIRYEFKNNYYWELKKFIRNNKNIL